MNKKSESRKEQLECAKESSAILINEAQLVLAEKRTSLAAMRTGIAVFAIPMSILSLLIATSKYYDVVHVMNLMIPLATLNVLLLVLGGYLIIRSLIRVHKHDKLIRQLKEQHCFLREFL